MIEDEIKNAVITGAEITNDDHGLLSAWVYLNYGGAGQGFGGYSLYLPESIIHHERQPNIAGRFIWRVMEIAGVEKWSQLTGKTIRVRSYRNQIKAIGHIVEDKWFEPSVEFDKMLEEK